MKITKTNKNQPINRYMCIQCINFSFHSLYKMCDFPQCSDSVSFVCDFLYDIAQNKLVGHNLHVTEFQYTGRNLNK